MLSEFNKRGRCVCKRLFEEINIQIPLNLVTAKFYVKKASRKKDFQGLNRRSTSFVRRLISKLALVKDQNNKKMPQSPRVSITPE